MDKIGRIRKEIERLKEELRKPDSAVYSESYIIGANHTLNTISDFLDILEEESASERFTFKSIPRLLEMIEPTDRAKAYITKLANTLDIEGYLTDAKIVRESLKTMNGEKVAMATMDGEHVSDDLEEAAFQHLSKYYGTNIIWDEDEKCVVRDFIAGAEWQKEKHERQFSFINLKDCKDAYQEWKRTQKEPVSAALSWVRACQWQKQQDQETIELAEDHAMLAGMEKMREKMMKDAVDGFVIEDIKEGNGDFLLSADYLPASIGLKDRQKVKVIVLKDE